MSDSPKSRLAAIQTALVALVALATLIVPAATAAAVRGGPIARSATAHDLLSVYDASAGAEPMGGWEPYARFRVSGDPRVSSNWPAWYEGPLPGVTRTARMDALTANARNVARTICDVRGYCGKAGWIGWHERGHSTINGYLPWEVLGNDPADNSHAHRFYLWVTIEDDHIMEGAGDPNQPSNDVIAHEFGHIMDYEYAGDRAYGQNIEGDAVEEAIADMFAYDYDWGDATIGEETGKVIRNWANPGAVLRDGQPYPAHMNYYDPTPPLLEDDDEPSGHFNSTILSHAYYLFVQKVGRWKAGRVLHNVPQRLSPRPTFEQLRRSFNQSASSIYGGEVAAKAASAFAAVGLLPPPPEEPDCGPEAC